MPTGTVKKVVVERGFGFIQPECSERKGDIFFHCSALPDRKDIDTLEAGTAVTFDLSKGEDGRDRAINVRRS